MARAEGVCCCVQPRGLRQRKVGGSVGVPAALGVGGWREQPEAQSVSECSCRTGYSTALASSRMTHRSKAHITAMTLLPRAELNSRSHDGVCVWGMFASLGRRVQLGWYLAPGLCRDGSTTREKRSRTTVAACGVG